MNSRFASTTHTHTGLKRRLWCTGILLEDQAEKGIPMTMGDWSTKLNAFLQFNDKELLEDFGKVTAAIAKTFAESEFEKYRPVQDKLFVSDFDREVRKLLPQ